MDKDIFAQKAPWPDFTDKEGIVAQLSSNPFFTAGFGLAGLGALAAFGRRGASRGVALLKRRLLVDVEISRKDESYEWFLHWMSQYHKAQLSNVPLLAGERATLKNSTQRSGVFNRIISRFTPRLHHLSIQTTKIDNPSGSLRTQFSLIPGPGKHILRYKNAFIAVSRERDTKIVDFSSGSPWETVKLTTLYSHRYIFEELFAEAHKLAIQSQEGNTVIFTAWGTDWQAFGKARQKRPLDSVILDKGVKERIVNDAKEFLRTRKWYLDRGIPYRRGYLLHGPPGTGKSSFISALAGELDYNIALLNLSERGLTDDRLIHLLAKVPTRTIVLLEDVDVAFSNRRTESDSDGYRGANVTFSGLLNALDGAASSQDRIAFLTTNHVDRLDPALVRPGRVDLTVRLGEASRWQVAELWDRFYGEVDGQEKAKQRFFDKLEKLRVIPGPEGAFHSSVHSASTAALQGLFLFNKGSPEGAIEMADGLVPRSRSTVAVEDKAQVQIAAQM
ncbi:MAG: hypothetical protein M1814_004939 [Vezdaea aestivalis]|nr:MAG: hypothetical protein M1814_004939 [Vezdaea aestivalis]